MMRSKVVSTIVCLHSLRHIGYIPCSSVDLRRETHIEVFTHFSFLLTCLEAKSTGEGGRRMFKGNAQTDKHNCFACDLHRCLAADSLV
jgi:hypothetical protein